MPITPYLPFEPTPGQRLAIRKFVAFFQNSGQIFVLQGYAGTGKTKEVKMIKDLLYRSAPGLTYDEDKAFTIDFAIRMKHRNIKPHSDDFLHCLITDRRLNALRVKFGYAVTCHKAQGGEWERGFLNIEPALGKMPLEGQYRWMYTAITRASSNLVIPNHSILYYKAFMRK